MSFTANASTFTSGPSSGNIGCSLLDGTNNTSSVGIKSNTQINPYPSTGMSYGYQCFFYSLATTNYLYISGGFYPGGHTIYITASQLNSMAVPPPNQMFPGRFFIGATLVMFHYSSQTYTNKYGSNQLLPNEFITPAPPGGSLNPYGGLQASVSFVVQPCGVPTSLSATSYQSGQVPLSWSAPGDTGGSAITNYLIQYSSTSSSGPWSVSFNTASSTPSYVFSGLTNGTTYYFQVAAVNGYCNNGTGYGPDSGLFSASSNPATPATTPDPPPFASISTTAGVSSISVVWNPPLNNGGADVISYTLQYRILGSGSSFTPVTGILPTPTPPHCLIGNLNPSTTYEIQVASVNPAGQGSYSSSVIGSTDTTPDNPTITIPGVHGNQQVTISWTAPSNDGGTQITGYLVEFKLDSLIVPPGSWTQILTGSTALTYIVGPSSSPTPYPLTNGTLYDFRVSAVNAVGVGSHSNIIEVTPSTIPIDPVIIPSVICDNQQVLVKWYPPVDDGGAPISSYFLRYTTDLTAPVTWSPTLPYSVPVPTPPTPTMSFIVPGLINGTPYYFQVAAVNLNGTGPYSASSTATPSITPQPPIPINTTAVTSTSIAVSWTTPTGLANTGGNPITGYIVYWTEISSTGSLIPPTYSYDTTTGGTPLATAYTIPGLTYATLYEIQVSSINCSGVGALSSLPNSLYSLYVTTASIPPSAPTNVTITGCNSTYTNSITLTWTSPANNGGSPITNYIVYYRTTSPPNSTWYTYNTNSASTTAIVSVPSSGVSYDFKVAAQNSAGAGIFSPIVSSLSYNPPTAPTNLVANTNSSGFVVLTWNASTQELPQTISYYVIEYKICEFGGWITYPTTIPSPTTPIPTISVTIDDSNIANNVTYLYRVYAVNSCGAQSPLSNTASGTSYNNNAPTYLWSRFNLNCSGNITSIDNLNRNMLRKGQVLQYPVVGTLQFSRATLWSMAAKNQLTRKKAWASQSEEYTYPNTTNINNQPDVGLRQTPTSLVCWRQPPAVICNSSTASDVPGNPTTLCISKNAPFDNFRRPVTYSSGGTKFPVFFSK
jgi:titin